MSAIVQGFEIIILDYSKYKNRPKTFVNRGVSPVVFNGDNATHMVRADKVKLDVNTEVPCRTMFRFAKNHNQAMQKARNIAERIGGSVLQCRKISTSGYFEKIEHLNLKQQPFTVEMAEEDLFILNANGELTPTLRKTKMELEQKYELEIDLDDKQ